MKKLIAVLLFSIASQAHALHCEATDGSGINFDGYVTSNGAATGQLNGNFFFIDTIDMDTEAGAKDPLHFKLVGGGSYGRSSYDAAIEIQLDSKDMSMGSVTGTVTVDGDELVNSGYIEIPVQLQCGDSEAR